VDNLVLLFVLTGLSQCRRPGQQADRRTLAAAQALNCDSWGPLATILAKSIIGLPDFEPFRVELPVYPGQQFRMAGLPGV